jgi:hypothetical protein
VPKVKLRGRPKGVKRPSLSSLKKKAWKLLSELVRRNKNGAHVPDGWNVCYTCDAAKPWQELQAGHAIPGRTGAVLLDEEILRPQDAKCNIWGRGMHHVFAAKLIKENGMDWWEQKLSTSRQIKKWSRDELEQKIESYKARLQALG